MIATRLCKRLGGAAILASLMVAPLLAMPAPSKVVSREIHSANFAQSKIGTSPVRKMMVYLPAGYDDSSARYPVIYFFPDSFAGYSGPIRSQRRARPL